AVTNSVEGLGALESGGRVVGAEVGVAVGAGVGETQSHVMVTAASTSEYTSESVASLSLQSHCWTSMGCSVDESSSAASLHLRSNPPASLTYPSTQTPCDTDRARS
ncbi:unnamed protein product, partial [Ectocarpus sp. 13 AM-2016]